MSNTVNLGDGKWAIKDSELLGYSLTDEAELIALTLDVSRASSGTRVNSSGLIETVTKTLSGDLITNGDFATPTTVGWSDSYLCPFVVENNMLKATAQETGSGMSYQINGLTIGAEYAISWDYINGSGTLPKWRVTNSNQSALRTYSNNSNSFYFIPTATTVEFSPLFQCGTAGTFYFDNVSVVEVNRDNLARIDYTDSTDGVLLTEPQSTNLIAESEDFSDSYWLKTNASVVSGQAAPSVDNPTSAFKAVNNSNNGHVSKTIYVTNGVEYATSVFVKKGNSDTFKISHSNIGDTVFNLVTGVVVSGNGTIDNIGNGWFRCTKIQTGVSIGYFVLYYGIPNSLVNDYFYIFGAQLEELPYATSYITTSGAIASRASDVINNGGEAINFNSEEGVLFAEIADLGTTSSYRLIEMSDGSNSNRIYLAYTNVDNRIRVVVKVANSDQFDYQYTLTDATEFNKIAFKYKENDFALWVNGAEVYTDSSGITFPSDTLNVVSFSNTFGSENFYGKTKNIQVFKEVLTDAQLITLTTI